jgi:hypothetical protein
MYTNMHNKIASFKYFSGTNKSIFPVIICPSGILANAYTKELIQAVVVLDNLFV